MQHLSTIKGFADLFAPESTAFTHMEAVARRVFARFGFQELRTPVLEYTELFARGIGTETDVVQKEMYTFEDRGGRSVTLRPEATAGVMRAYLESGRHKQESVTRLFTFGPMFRYERPQKGRMRQFHQINCECLGPNEPSVDAELVVMVMRFMGELGIADLTLQLNSLGCAQCRPAYRALLHDWLSKLDRDALCEDCRRRMDTNPLRVLDCKVPTCKALTEQAPRIADHICPDCQTHFAAVQQLISAEQVPFELNPRLVRGLDYYSRTTFEVVSQAIGAQGSVAGGGRYDGLSGQLGGPDVAAIGFACGMERLAMLLPESACARPDFHVTMVGLHAEAGMEEAGRGVAFGLCQALRDAGFAGDMAHSSRSMKAAMRQADKSGARCTFILGPDELAAGQVVIKGMDSGVQHTVALAAVPAAILQHIPTTNLKGM